MMASTAIEVREDVVPNFEALVAKLYPKSAQINKESGNADPVMIRL